MNVLTITRKCFIPVLISLATAACVSTKADTSDLMKKTAFTISAEELRVRVRNEARPMAGILETSADALIAGTDDPVLRYESLRWKTEAIPALFNALFRPDPVAALVDTSAFVEQMRLFFLSGIASRLNDDQIAIALNAAEQMKARLQAIYLKAGASQSQIDAFWQKIEKWAAEHPMQGSFTVRDSTTMLLAQFLSSSGGGFGAAVGTLQEGMADMAARLDLLAEFLPRQARWQAEMLIEHQLRDRLAERVIDQVGPLPLAVQSLPFDVQAEREALLAELRNDGTDVGAWMDDELSRLMRFVSSERESVALLVAAERFAVLEAIQSERESIIDAVRHERVAAFSDLSDIVEDAMTRSRVDVVDHLVFRLAQLLAVVVPVVFAGCFFLVWYARRPRKT